MFPEFKQSESLEALPWLPVRAFKLHELKSVASDQVFKVMLSSGTGGIQSRIYLDQSNARAQQAKLIEVFSHTFGKGRYPMLVIDSEATVKERRLFSARTAAINGFSIFSRGREFALNDDMQLDLDRVSAFLEKVSGKAFLLFGFTYVVWEQMVRKLELSGARLDFSKAFLVHGGGWKKLESQKVSTDEFKARIFDRTGCSRVHNYYGMIEQTGSIYMECSEGHLHAPSGADFLIRSTQSLGPLPEDQTGLVQLFSDIQTSYPGHSLLSEDLGRFYPASACSCGSSGRILKVIGRAERAEVRGCSDAVN
ncbi:MAG: long-chain fatty acid--CoA ligase [Sedimenticola sp.]|nr:long-chain fatty acid--CoA ligase [Sedimenticola sp.]